MFEESSLKVGEGSVCEEWEWYLIGMGLCDGINMLEIRSWKV